MQTLDVRWIFPVLFLTGLALVGCAGSPLESHKMASAEMKSRSDSNVEGHVHFHQVSENVNLAYEFKGLVPNTKHGFHAHEKGDCSAPDAASAGGHFNPTKHSHGGLKSEQHHAGDFGNIESNVNGIAKGELTLEKTQADQFRNLALIVHAKQDDEKTQPSGDSGPRVACGVVQ